MQRLRQILGLSTLIALLVVTLLTTSVAPTRADFQLPSGGADLDDLDTDVELEFEGINTNGSLVIYNGWTNSDGLLYFIDNYETLYAWDGTAVMKVETFEYANSMQALDGKVYFLGNPVGGDPYVHIMSVDYDGSNFTTEIVVDSYVHVSPHGLTFWRLFKRNDNGLQVHDGKLYTLYEKGSNISPPTTSYGEVGFYDPNTDDFVRVWRRSGATGGKVLGSAGDYLYFKASVLGEYPKLYAYNSGGAVNAIHPYTLHSPDHLVAINDVAYFKARSNAHGSEIWRSNGTSAGTEVIDLYPGTGSSSPQGIVSVNNKLFFYLWSDNPRQLYTAYLNDAGVVTADTVKVVKEINCEWLDVATNTLFFHVSGPNGGFYRSDGTGYGTVKLTSENVTGVGMLNGRLLVNHLGSSSHALMATQATPTNVDWIGLRASYYGIQDEDANPPFGGDPGSNFDPDYAFPVPGQWEAAAKATSSYFPGSEAKPTLVWIVTRPRVDQNNAQKGGSIVQMYEPSGVTFDNKIYFNDDIENNVIPGNITVRDYHEAYLDYFDAAGINVYVQVEPGWAPLEDDGSTKGLLTAVLDYLIREDQDPNNEIHESVIGIGVDVEWYNNCEEGKSEEGHVNGEETAVARWYNQIHNPNNSSRQLNMFLKHWHQQYMPNYSTLKTAVGANEIGNIMFVNDSQGAMFYAPNSYVGSGATQQTSDALDTLMGEFSAWASDYPDSPVGYQIAYPNDWDSPNKTSCGWGHYLDNDGNELWGEGGINDRPGQNAVPKDEAWKLIAKFGYEVAEAVAASSNNTNQVALFYVDFRARMLYEHDVEDADWESQDGPGIFEWHDYNYPGWISDTIVLSNVMAGHRNYYVHDLVTHDGDTWRCTQIHEPNPSREPGTSGGAAYWDEEGFSGIDPWTMGVWYNVGDAVTYNGSTWDCVYAHTSQVDWYPGAPGLWFWEER